MAIADEVRARTSERAARTRCRTCAWIAAQPEADEWNAVMIDRSHTTAAIYDTLVSHQFTGSIDGLRSHRKAHAR